MSIDNNNAKPQVSADKLLTMLFDDGLYTELTPLASSQGELAEVLTACGKVQGQSVYAFAQCEGRCGGAMTVAQAEKLKRLYALALKTGYPIVGFYIASGGKVSQGNMLLDALGDLVASAGRLSGIVPQISVVLGDCVSTTAMLASVADFVVMTEDAKFTLSADSECNGTGNASVVVEEAGEAVDTVINLISYLPANNLSACPVANEAVPTAQGIYDKDSEVVLSAKTGEGATVALARLDGKVVGSVKTLGKELDGNTCKKIARFVRFCDAFSIPVITEVDAADFCCLSGAKAVLSAYTDATTVKISVITGLAVGPVYMALAGKGSRADAVLATEGATISPIKPEAAAYLALDGTLTGTVKEQDAQIAQYVATELCAENAAKAGYIDDVADKASLRNKLINYICILSGKREASLPKKHSTI